MDNSSFGSLAVLPFTDKLNTRGLARGQINKDRKDERVIEKTRGPVSAAGTAPHKSSLRGRGAYDPSAPRGHGAVAGISPFCECLNVCCCFCFVLFLFLFLGIRCCGVRHCPRSLLMSGTRRCVLESNCWIRLYWGCLLFCRFEWYYSAASVLALSANCIHTLLRVLVVLLNMAASAL